jgi:plasmid maintenance system antidote protein VapI
MNITEMAEHLDVSVATVSRICSAERRPSIDLILKIRSTLGWSMESQADALRESTSRYAVEFKQRMERRRVRRTHRDDAFIERCNDCEHKIRQCICVEEAM